MHLVVSQVTYIMGQFFNTNNLLLFSVVIGLLDWEGWMKRGDLCNIEPPTNVGFLVVW